jgi:hypothetical protein
MYWDRTRKCGSDDFTSYGSCFIGSDNTSLAMAISVMVVNSCAVVLADYEAYKARNVSTEFSESRYIGFAMLSILQVGLVGIPIIFLVQDNPPARFFVGLVIITVVCMSVLLLIFIPKMSALRRERYPDRAAVNEVQQGDDRKSSDFALHGRSSMSGFARRRRNSSPSQRATADAGVPGEQPSVHGNTTQQGSVPIE